MRVFGLGETVYDIIFKNGVPQAAKAGGSVLNALVSLARTGIETYFISELGKDQVGNLILSFLHQNKINTTYVQQYENAQSALALAFLNENNDASYEFYKNYPDKRLQIDLPDFQAGDILLFGSSFAIDTKVRTQVEAIVAKAKKSGATVFYDPNYRAKDGADEEQCIAYVMQNIALADIVRASNEDCQHLLKVEQPQQVYEIIKKQCACLIHTSNASGIHALSEKGQFFYHSEKLKPVSTIGAGDNFNAGIIYSLVKYGFHNADLSLLEQNDFDTIIPIARQFASAVCMSMDNYVPEGFQVNE